MADSTPKSYHTDPNLYLYTSLTAGSSHIITATSRLETILKANKIPFLALDVATDEKARMLWGRRAGKKKLPGLVRMGMIIGDLEEVEEWNEYGELKEKLASGPATATSMNLPAPATPSKAPSKAFSSSEPILKPSKPADGQPEQSQSLHAESSLTTAMRQVSLEAAKKAGDAKADARAELLEANKTLKKTDTSAPIPPPTGTTKASSAIAPETGSATVQSKADNVPPVSGPPINPTEKSQPPVADTSKQNRDEKSRTSSPLPGNSKNSPPEQQKGTKPHIKFQDDIESQKASRLHFNAPDVFSNKEAEGHAKSITDSGKTSNPPQDNPNTKTEYPATKIQRATDATNDLTQEQPAAVKQEAEKSVGD